jgi:hypothetical protein
MQTTAKEVALQLKRSAGRGLEGHQALRASSEELEHLGGPKMTAESDRSPALRVERLAPVRQLSKVIAWTGLFSVGRLWKRGRCQRQRAMRGASRHQISDSRDFRTCSLTPELSRTALRPWAGENFQNLHEAAKRARLERIVRQRPRHTGKCQRNPSPPRRVGQREAFGAGTRVHKRAAPRLGRLMRCEGVRREGSPNLCAESGPAWSLLKSLQV